MRLYILLLHDVQRHPLNKGNTGTQKQTQSSKWQLTQDDGYVQNSSHAYHSLSVCCQATHWSSIWKSCQKEQLTQSNSMTAKITQNHILGILQNIVSDVHILTENKSVQGHLPNYKEVQFYNINRRKLCVQCATALCTEGSFFLVVREPHSSVGCFIVEVSVSHTSLTHHCQ